MISTLPQSTGVRGPNWLRVNCLTRCRPSLPGHEKDLDSKDKTFIHKHRFLRGGNVTAKVRERRDLTTGGEFPLSSSLEV